MIAEYSQAEMTWTLVDLVKWGIKRCAEADRLGHPFIIVSQLYQGSSRISSRIEPYACVVPVHRKCAADLRAAFLVLKRGEHGWFVSEFMNCVGDRTDVNAQLAEIRRGAAA